MVKHVFDLRSILKRKRLRWWLLNLRVMLPYGGKTLSEKESAWKKQEIGHGAR